MLTGLETSQRIEKAKNLLLHTELTAAQVADRVGFSKPQSLSRAFPPPGAPGTDLNPKKNQFDQKKPLPSNRGGFFCLLGYTLSAWLQLWP
jgi:hypothetical protein